MGIVFNISRCLVCGVGYPDRFPGSGGLPGAGFKRVRHVRGVVVMDPMDMKVRLMAEVHRQMKMEGDYAAYYYHPGAHAKYARIMKEEVEMIQRIEGGSDK